MPKAMLASVAMFCLIVWTLEGAAEVRPAKTIMAAFSAGWHVAPPPPGPVIHVQNTARGAILLGTADNHRQWRESAAAMQSDFSALRACLADRTACADKSIARWADVVRKARDRSGLDRIGFVNRRINGLIVYRGDRENYGREDYWAGPREAFRRGGDCEDLAIAKYWTLRALDIAPARLRLLIFMKRRQGRSHAVLQVAMGQENILLDNLTNKLLRPADAPDYLPFFSLNEQWKWLHPVSGNSGEKNIAPPPC